MAFSPLSNLGIIQNLNYIANSDFNTFPFASNATLGWSLKNGGTPDATTKLPTSAPSAAAAGTLSLSSVSGGSQISGTVSASLSSTAATTAGDMLITDALTLDTKAQASVQTFSFFYKVTSNGTGTPNFSGTSSNAIGVAIYDVTNSAWIQPAGVFNLVQSSLVGKAAGTFQVPSNCTSVRLAVYFPNSTAASGGSPFTVLFDDFVLGPQIVQFGAPVTDWQAFTPTVTTSTGTISNYTSSGFWRRVGGDMEVVGGIAFTSTSSVFADVLVSIPSFATIDLTKTLSQQVGYAAAYDAAISIYEANVITNNATRVIIYSVDASIARAGAASITNTSPFTFNTGDQISYSYKVPIQGWSSSVQMSNDTDTRVVAGSFYATSSTTVNTTASTITYSGTSLDTHGVFSSGTTYTVPVSGVYRIVSQALFNCTAFVATETVDLAVSVNGSAVSLSRTTVRNGGFSSLNPAETVLSLKAGDTVTSYAVKASANISGTIYLDGAYSKLLIQRLSGNATIAASETVAAKYWATASQTISAATRANYDGKIYDTHNAVTTGASWVFTAPISGRYRTSLWFNNSAAVTGNPYIDLYIDGSAYEGIVPIYGLAGTGTGSSTVYLNAGQTIQIRASGSYPMVGAATISNSARPSYIDIERIGN